MNNILRQIKTIAETTAACMMLVVLWKVILIMTSIINNIDKVQVAR